MPSGGASFAVTGATRPARRATSVGSWANPLPWLGALLVLYLVLPLVGLVSELARGHGAGFGAPGLEGALVVSLETASCTTALCALFGVPLAYQLARRRGRLASVVGALVLLPLALPPLMAGILLVSVIGPDTVLGALFSGRLTDSLAGIVLAQIFVAAPFTVVAARSAFGALEPALFEVGATLGIRRTGIFWRVALPAAARGVGAGLGLTWLRAFGEFGATIVVAYHPYSLPIFTYVRFSGFGLAQATAPAAMALGAALVVLAFARLRFPRRATAAVLALTPALPERREMVGALRFGVDCRLGSFSLRVAHRASGSHLAVLGPSGAGKTTLLRCLAGVVPRSTEMLFVGDRALGGLSAQERRVGYVPQEPCLLPNRTLWQQVTLGPQVEAGLAAYWIERLGLRHLEQYLPEQLSGGQRQRVALARALAADPELMLLDEPFAALDVAVRHQLQHELRLLLQERTLASIVVTHDPQEAALLASELLVVDAGRILQAGPTAEVFTHPATPAVARLLGVTNIFGGRITAADRIESDGAVFEVPEAILPAIGDEVLVGIRAEHVIVSFSPNGAGSGRAVVLDAAHLGTVAELRLGVTDGPELLVRVPTQMLATPGTACSIQLPATSLSVWPAEANEPILSRSQAWSAPQSGRHIST